MTITTTHFGAKKSFAWSYSKLKNFDTCPKRYYEIDVAKTYKEADGEQLKWGNEVHEALANRLGKGVPLPPTMSNFEDMVSTIEQMPHEQLLVECKFAITKEFNPCEYFAKDVWFRSIADVLKINKMVALAVDYKTGKILEDSQQLALVAATVFAHFPNVQAVRCEFWWLKDDAKSEDTFYRKDMPDMWRGLWPRIQALEHAHETMTFPPKPSHLCRKWCPVTSCPHNGK